MAMPMYNSTYNHFSDDTTPYTFHSITPPSHSGSDESPYCSPRQHAADIVGAFAPLPPPLPQEKQHTTSGVSLPPFSPAPPVSQFQNYMLEYERETPEKALSSPA
ncbi:hypothetical protein EJ05DRAFT_471936 [Pseudovirgaria hyperparasitica]|uniref:Uncharacterized protein n=1 Tax=Pseudovirgaria hyperparasitica TaxID=470096 RepID=A0A6A6WLA6_9PEZI|nr:uncharacterized protein EJ05DRAFT_471936 [Pseudovirgaria hyperparasitica]KAF2762977.1 hypothetical protein EJ05DRAFT_471936 [Pseudovirgaria hyperparasitica]